MRRFNLHVTKTRGRVEGYPTITRYYPRVAQDALPPLSGSPPESTKEFGCVRGERAMVGTGMNDTAVKQKITATLQRTKSTIKCILRSQWTAYRSWTCTGEVKMR
jgi:hypothetical protein